MKSRVSEVVAADTPKSKAIETSWPEPLTAAEWDERYPGVLDAVAFMTGGANVIMQLGRPGVGYGVVESRVHSGSVFKNPFKRMRTTFTYLSVAVLGTTEEKLAYRRAVNKSHAQVYSTESSPVKYHAFDPELQLWVAACLYWGVVDTMEKFRGRLTDDEADAIFRLMKPLATTLQVRADMWPENAKAFEKYWNAQLANVHIDDTVRGFLRKLVDLDFSPVPIQFAVGPVIRFFTIGFLPERFREEMQYEWTETDQKVFDAAIAAISTVNRRLPRVVRQAPTLYMMWDFRRRLRDGLPLV